MPAIPFDQFRSEVLSLYEPPLRRKATRDKLRTVLGEFQALGLATTSDLTPSSIARWLSSPRAAARRAISNRSYLSALRPAVTIAVKMGWTPVDPFEIRKDWIDWAEEDETPPKRHWTIADVRKILDQADAEVDRGDWRPCRLQALLYTYVYTGLRKCEALGLRTADIELGAKVLVVRSHQRRRLKTRTSRRRIPLHQDLQRVLTRWLPRVQSEWLFPTKSGSSPWLYGPQGHKPLDQVQALAVRAGIDRGTIQHFRRSLATHGRRWGWGQLEVEELLGHDFKVSKEWYLEEDLDDARRAIDRIDYRTPPDSAAA